MVLENFVRQILIDKNYPDRVTDKAVYEELIRDGVERLEEKLKYCIFEAMPENEYPEFNRLMEQDDAEKLQAFILKTIPNLQELQAQAMLDFKDNYF